jgi:DNA-binding MarR family transcriptional regulator
MPQASPATRGRPSADAAGPPAVLADRLLYLVKRTAMVVGEATEPVLARFGLDNRTYTLLLLVDAEGPGSQQQLGTRLGIDRTTMVSLVDHAERGGFVVRRRNPADRRAYAIEMTPEGTRALAAARPEVEAAERALLAGLPAKDVAQAKRALQRLIAR